jgi:uncharacterized OsmC-like protein
MAKTVVLTQQEGVRFSARSGDHQIVIDWPEEEGGTNQGMSPGGLLCASLGACTAMYVVRYFKTLGVSLEGVTAETTCFNDQSNSKAERFEIRISLPKGLPKREKAIQKVAELCYVKKTLQSASECTVKIEGPGFD